jgi:hypothetical protein
METIKSKNNVTKGLMVGCVILVSGIVLSTALNILKGASESEVETVSAIQVLTPATTSPSPMIGQSDTNKNIEIADQELVLAGDYLDDMVVKMTSELVVARSKRWLIHASAEAGKANKTESEFLSDKLLYFLGELKTLSNNGALDPKPGKMDNFIINVLEVRSIAMALTRTPPGGANTRVNVSNVLRATGELYQKAISLNNAQRFGISDVLNMPVRNRKNPNLIEDGTGSAKSEPDPNDEPTELEEVLNEAN